ncbi:MAG: DUF5107 domain-containing protein [Anaerolineae bacterium]|nr:DUF5107 domain-containing protein [Anaerolineae bacterium]
MKHILLTTLTLLTLIGVSGCKIALARPVTPTSEPTTVPLASSAPSANLSQLLPIQPTSTDVPSPTPTATLPAADPPETQPAPDLKDVTPTPAATEAVATALPGAVKGEEAGYVPEISPAGGVASISSPTISASITAAAALSSPSLPVTSTPTLPRQLQNPVIISTSTSTVSLSLPTPAPLPPAAPTPPAPTPLPVQPTAAPVEAAPSPVLAQPSIPNQAAAPLVEPQSQTADPGANSACSAPSISETALSLTTYNYQAALLPTAPDDPVYPYPRLNHDQVGPPAPQLYRAVIMENCYLQLTILPDLGGRIYRWLDKASGQNLFYQNPVIKPTGWGNRGWWLATGGMEWALPVDEHGLSEASAWTYTLHQGGDQVGVNLSDTEDHSGLISEIMITLDAHHAYFTLAPRLINPTNAPVSYKFWLNAMFSLGSPQPGAGIEFVLPGGGVTIHSSGDSSLPGQNQPMSWPVFNGRNLSDYGTWTSYLGFFAAPAAQDDFMGAYNHPANLGVARIFPHLVARGAKVFGPANLDPNLWTTDGSSYFELWGGLAPTFADTVTLNPGEWVTWQERWYAVGNTGGFTFANEAAALKVKPEITAVPVAAVSTYPLDGQLVLWRDGLEVTRWPVSLAPNRPFQDSYLPPTPINGGAWGLTLIDETGQTLAATDPAAGPQNPATQGVRAAPNAQTAALYSPAPTQAEPVPAPVPSMPPTPLIITVTPISSVAPTSTPAPAPATPTLTSTPIMTNTQGQVLWDPRLDMLGIKLNRAQVEPGQMVYRLVAARFQDENEARGLHHVFVEVLDENGQRIVGQPVSLAWKDGRSTLITENKPAPEYAANAPLYGEMSDGTYEVYVDGAPSDHVSGLGLPGKHHVSYQLTFQRQAAAAGEPAVVSPYPVTPTPAASPTPTPAATTQNNNGATRLWDPRLDAVGVKVNQAQTQPGQPVYRLVAAHYWDENESQGLHHVFVEVVDEHGQRILGQPVILAWGNEKATMMTENKPTPEYAANGALYGALPDSVYRVYVDGAPSDVVEGIGLPAKHHVSYLLTFQRKGN